MASSFSGLSYQEIRTISNTLKTKANTMQGLLNNVKTQFNKIGGADVWSGTAANVAKQDFDQLSRKFPEFYEAVSSCAKYLDSVVSRYEAVDRAVSGK